MLEFNYQLHYTHTELNKMKFDFENVISINPKMIHKIEDQELQTFVLTILKQSPINSLHGVNPDFVINYIVDYIQNSFLNILMGNKGLSQIDFINLTNSLLEKGLIKEYTLIKNPFDLEPMELKYICLSHEGVQILNEANCIKTKYQI